MSVLLETSVGDIVVDLYTKEFPETCTNFLKLCKIKYYNDCQFFQIEKGFIAQTGDPKNNGQGGSSVFGRCYGPRHSYFRPEYRPQHISHSQKGTVSMTAGTGTAANGVGGLGSQFFITLSSGLSYLDDKHGILGYVAEGWDTLRRIETAVVDEKCRPYRLIRLRHTVILHDPFPDPPNLFPDGVEPSSPPPAQGGDGDRLGSDEEPEDTDEPILDAATSKSSNIGQRDALGERERREARSRAEVLEMIGDIGDADLKPPDNVLFVCKLNPVTRAEDLEIIFSRFGDCKAEVIQDRHSGESLCYGFIEYSSREACERAFFKMDNCLIDDRRVRVDFSQSVSKLWNAKQRGVPTHYRHIPNRRPA